MTWKLISSIVHRKFFVYSVFTVHISSMLIFFLVVLQTKKLLIGMRIWNYSLLHSINHSIKLKVSSICFCQIRYFQQNRNLWLEACNFIRKCCAKLSCRKSLNYLKRATMQDPLQENFCDGVLFNEIEIKKMVGIAKKSAICFFFLCSSRKWIC